MHIASGKCDIFSTPLFCLTLHTVSVYVGVPKKHLKKLSSVISLAKRLLHVKDDTDFKRILQQPECKMLRKIMETEKHILADLIPLRQPYATEKLRGRPPPTNPVGFQNINILPDRCLRKKRTLMKHNLLFLLYICYLEYWMFFLKLKYINIIIMWIVV